MAKLALYWPVCSDGYRLGIWGGGKTIAQGDPGQWIFRNSDQMRCDVDVMQIPALYGRLADNEPTAEGALAFVTKYGFLTNAANREPAEGICDQIKLMRHLLALRDDRNQDALDKWLNKNSKVIRLNAVIREGQCPRLFFEPERLSDAIYLQFFQDIESGANVRLCARPGCGEWFYFGPGTNPPRRNTAIYCSPKCQKAHSFAKSKGEA